MPNGVNEGECEIQMSKVARVNLGRVDPVAEILYRRFLAYNKHIYNKHIVCKTEVVTYDAW